MFQYSVVERPSPASCSYAAGAMAAVDARTVPAPAQAIRVPTVCQARAHEARLPAIACPRERSHRECITSATDVHPGFRGTPDRSHARTCPSPPQFNPMSSDSAIWKTRTGQEFSDDINDAYSKIVHWKHNLFMIPSGAQGKRFVGELARLFNAFASESALEVFAIKAAMTMPALLLQKPI